MSRIVSSPWIAVAPRLVRRLAPFFAGPALALAAAGCAGRAPDVVDGPAVARDEPAVVSEARRLFPRTIDMHQKIVSRSCSPNAGVCHNTSNYPDLSTTGSLLQTVDAWCNLEMPDPTQGFDLCERPGDLVVIDNVMISEIAYAHRDAVDHWTLTLRDPAPSDVVAHTVYFYEDVPDKPVLLPAADWQVQVDMAAGSNVAVVTINGLADNPFVDQYVDEVLASLVPGDPNENGVFGADTHDIDAGARIVEPGSLDRSYLWGRITGTVPGSRMPLANQALSDAEYVAVACFIETLGAATPDGSGVVVASPEDPIDYDNCQYAKNPQHLALDP